MSLLEVKDVKKVFSELVALDGAELVIAENQFHGLIGPNGSGKSTLLKCIAGAETVSAGEIHFLGSNITGRSATDRARSGMSLKFQITSVFDTLSVYDNVLLSLQAEGTPWQLMRSHTRKDLDSEVLSILEQFRLDNLSDDLAEELSHGQKQWLEIAMAMARNPKLLLLDEPTAGMSPEERRVTGELLGPIKTSCSILIVEHDLDFIKNISDVITVLGQGKILDHGTPAEIEVSEKVQEVYVTRV